MSHGKKYGFVYIWYDRKHKRYYIGCHWGNENDKYICSSSWMRNAYKRRPHDFKRRILVSNIQNKTTMLEEEHKYLSMIKKEELGNKYYNLLNHKFNHWSANQELTEKVKAKRKYFKHSQETKTKIGESGKGRVPWNKGKKLPPLTEDNKIKILTKTKKTNLEKLGVEFPFQSKEIQEKIRQNRTEDEHKIIQEKIRQTSKEKYGTDHFFSSEEIQKKVQNTFKEKYGVERVCDIPHVKEKKKILNLGKIWVKHHQLGQKRIRPNELDEYLKNGYTRGLNNKPNNLNL